MNGSNRWRDTPDNDKHENPIKTNLNPIQSDQDQPENPT